MSAGVFAAVAAALYVGHHVGDHWVQTSAQALGKGAAGWSGRWACARHVATLTVVKLVALVVTAAVVGLPISAAAVAAALTLDAVAHYAIDRREHGCLPALARLLRKEEFLRLGDGGAAPCGTGAYALDQSAHLACLWAAALLACMGVPG